jgi:excisionase family DNA binding protein
MGYLSSVAARELGISARTLSKWADRGIIHAERTNGGWRLFPPEEIERVRRLIEHRQREFAQIRR